LFERGDQGVLGQIFGQPDIADEPSEPRNEPRRLDPPDRIDRPPCGGVGDYFSAAI
jgi:hypothetical protein